MNQIDSEYYQKKRKVRLLKLDGMKYSAGSGAKKITYFLQFTPAQPVEVAGFAITRALGSCDYCGEIIPICGR